MNEVQNFLFEGLGIRGSIVRLEETWRQVLAEHRYPDSLRQLLGESLAATVLLTTGLKGAPKVSLQLQGEGPVKLLLIQCSSELKVRGMAQWRDAAEGEPLLGEGRLTVNLDTGEDDHCFQGIVPLVSDRLDACLEGYFRQSEQLPTRLMLTGTQQRVAGLLLQALPNNDGADHTFNTAAALAATVSPGELSELPADRLLATLFDNYTIRLFKPRRVTHDCRCTPSHLAGVVRLLGADELESLIEETGEVELTCEFCNRAFRYDAADVEAILDGDTPG
ncbi:MAG: Hsp33 family molecular chaperone HslO, partial [Gammaproteobacteria bacterium]